MKGKQYDVAKLTNDRNLADSFGDQDINQLYEQFINETNKITESIVDIKRNP